jgi:hypothetical protein
MTKTELLKVYVELRRNLAASLVSAGLLGTCQDLKPLESCVIKLGDLPVPLKQELRYVFPDGPPAPIELRNNFICISVRTVYKEAFQSLNIYAKETGQWRGALKREGWFQFLRIMRNLLEHTPLTDARFHFTDIDKRHNLPLVWRGKRIDVAMDGLPIDFSFFSPSDALNLLADAECYIKNSMR